MTDEELDRARAEEAYRLEQERLGPSLPLSIGAYYTAEIAARLAREGWTPEDPLLKEARELAVRFATASDEFASIMSGGHDGDWRVKFALAALKRGIELGKAKALTHDTETINRLRAEALKPGGVTYIDR